MSKNPLTIIFLFVFLSLFLFWPVFVGKVNLNGNLLVSFYAPYGENLPFKNTGWDQLRIYFPFLRVTLEAFKNFEIPLWNPYAFSGHPHLADFQSAVFYPLNIFGLFLTQIEFWHLLRVTPSILAAFFTFLYLRALKPFDSAQGQISKVASFFGALTFGFSPFILTWGEEVVMSPHSIVWLPLILFAIEKYLDSSTRHPGVATTTIGSDTSNRFYRSPASPDSLQNDKKVYLAIIALSTAFSFFGGYMQTSIYMFIFIGAYFVIRFFSSRHPEPIRSEHLSSGTHGRRLVSGSNLKIPDPASQVAEGSLRSEVSEPRFQRAKRGEQVRNDIEKSLSLIGAFVLGVGIAAVQLLPSAELYFNAARSQIALREKLFDFLLPPESLLTYLAPDFFGHPATANFFRRGDAQYYEGILFVGVAALIFAIYAIFAALSHPRGVRESGAQSGIEKGVGGDRRLVTFLAVSGLIALSTSLDLPTSKLFLSLPIPFLSTSIANRVLFISAFCLAVLAAIGFEKWLSDKKLEVLKSVLIIAGCYSAILVILLLVSVFDIKYFEHRGFVTSANLMVSLRNLVIPLAVFTITVILICWGSISNRWRQKMAFLIVAVAFLHIFYFSQKYFSFSDRKYVFPANDVLEFIRQNQGIYRSWGVGTAFFENNFASLYGIFWPEGYDSLNNQSYGEFTYAMQGANINDFVFRADAGLGRGETAQLVENPARRRLIDMVGVKYVVVKSDEERVMNLYNFRKVFDPSVDAQPTPGVSSDATLRTPGVLSGGEGFSVFENLTVMPRAFLASNYEGAPDIIAPPTESESEKATREKARRKLIFQKLLDSDFDFRNVLILEKPSPISAQFGPGTAQIVSYKPNEVVVKTSSDQPKLLFLSDNFYPGWKATVDGDETEIWRANYTFRAVPLIAGEHVVRFYYDSWVFKLGLGISVVSIVTLMIFVLKTKFSIFNFQF